MPQQLVNEWVQKHPLTPVHVDCSITVMLKILDGKCKMKTEEKVIMSCLYEAVKNQPAALFGPEINEFIQEARSRLDEDMKNRVYEKRLLAETMISRPVMKAFKAMIREQGLFAEPNDTDLSV